MKAKFLKQEANERQWISSSSNSGWLVPDAPCPVCGNRVLYNGNYFCEHWDMYGGCDWALAHPATRVIDKLFCKTLGLPFD